MEVLMTEPNTIPKYDDQHYAVVDLGSNSFHLSISQLTDNTSLKVVNKVKQKVRLAAGLTCDNKLTAEAINRGLACLKIFALHLATIPTKNIIVVATAALRIARNNDDFINQANNILPKNIHLLSGEQEAKAIYAGVAYTDQSISVNSGKKETRLVLDIGGASTDIIIGEASNAKKLVSLNIGCVSFINQHFSDGLLSEDNFKQCIDAASIEIKHISKEFKALGWQSALGSSGTMQAMAEILTFQQKPAIITLAFLQEVKKILIDCKTIENITIGGLRCDRVAILASGLSILIALFNDLSIENMKLSTGALREGLLSQLLPEARLVK
jgi:exopolyphosphatase/guanosine-5'-triphosphate,3'-diphosphate pyrophosphatase